MKNTRTRAVTFIVTLLTVLAISAMQVVPVLADDAAPPPPEATEVAPPEQESTPEAPPVEPAEAPATDVEEVPPTEAPVVPEVQVVPVVETQAEAPVAPPETPAEVLAQVPAGTELVVLDESGEALSLASEEAVEAFYTGDPQWCPVGVTPGSASCSGVKDSFNGTDPATDLIQWLIDNPRSVAGVIWISGDYQGTTDPGSEGGAVVLNGDLFVNPLNLAALTITDYALTIKGGWNSGTVVDAGDPSEFNVPFSIVNWNGNVTISDIVIQNATGAAGVYALDVETTKNISLTNVDVVGNTTASGGARLDNTPGPAGTVVVNDSSFNGNTGAGLEVYSPGTFTARNLSAHDNTGNGVSIDNCLLNKVNPADTDTWLCDNLSARAVTLTGYNNFNSNDGNGLEIYATGAVTLSNVTAIYNGVDGAYIDNCLLDDHETAYPLLWVCNQSYISAVTLKGSSTFSNNGETGLTVYTSGKITASNLTANQNGQTVTDRAGAYLFNFATYPVQAVTLSGVNTFNDNAGPGLWVDAYGNVTINNLTAINNGYGAACTANICDGAHVQHSMNFLLAGYGRFDNNRVDGLDLASYKVVTLNNLSAAGNGGNGVSVDNNANAFTVEVVNVLGTNLFTGNTGTGLWIDSQGAVTLNNLTANHNGAGVYVENTQMVDPNSDPYSDVLAGKNVTLKGLSTFNDNTGAGLRVESTGAIVTSGITAIANGQGVYLDNCFYNGTSSCTGLAGKAVTLGGSNNINLSTTTAGLSILSLGAIKVNNLTASDNVGSGAILNNGYNSAIGGVTLTGFATTSGNNISGLQIYSQGAVTTSNLTATDNGPWATGTAAEGTFYRGVIIQNATNNLKLMNVSLLGTNTFTDNWDSGLMIWSYGNIILNNITASGNGASASGTNTSPDGYGAYVDNYDAAVTAVKTVTVNGSNFFNGNLWGGLTVFSRGAVIVNKPTANENGLWGLSIDNETDTIAAPVTILGYGIFRDNDAGDGLEITSNGSITLNNITAIGNSGNGVELTNTRFINAATIANVTLKGTNMFLWNGDTGLDIDSQGTVTLSNITASHNGAGVSVANAEKQNSSDSSWIVAGKNVTLIGLSTFNDNTGTGLQIASTGVITTNGITAISNGKGADLDNCFYNGIMTCQGPLGKGITLKGVNFFNENDELGLSILSRGAVLVSKPTANENGQSGVFIDNESDANAVAVTILGYGTFNNNGGHGLNIVSNGSITLNNITASDNGGSGVDLTNDRFTRGAATDSAVPVNVILKGTNTFNSNGAQGLQVMSDGLITLNNVTASYNNGSGAVLDNDTWMKTGNARNILMNGWNSFLHNNGGNGLEFHASGSVTLTRITADWNQLVGPDTGNGILGEAGGSITLTCGSLNLNEAAGYDLTAGTFITLKGVFTYGNTAANVHDAPTVNNTRSCPLP